MLYREIIAVCSEIHTKHINTLCGQNVEFVNVEPGSTQITGRALNNAVEAELFLLKVKINKTAGDGLRDVAQALLRRSLFTELLTVLQCTRKGNFIYACKKSKSSVC
jgi:hypothetical protein